MKHGRFPRHTGAFQSTTVGFQSNTGAFNQVRRGRRRDGTAARTTPCSASRSSPRSPAGCERWVVRLGMWGCSVRDATPRGGTRACSCCVEVTVVTTRLCGCSRPKTVHRGYPPFAMVVRCGLCAFGCGPAPFATPRGRTRACSCSSLDDSMFGVVVTEVSNFVRNRDATGLVTTAFGCGQDSRLQLHQPRQLHVRRRGHHQGHHPVVRGGLCACECGPALFATPHDGTRACSCSVEVTVVTTRL